MLSKDVAGHRKGGLDADFKYVWFFLPVPVNKCEKGFEN